MLCEVLSNADQHSRISLIILRKEMYNNIRIPEGTAATVISVHYCSGLNVVPTSVSSAL